MICFCKVVVPNHHLVRLNKFSSCHLSRPLSGDSLISFQLGFNAINYGYLNFNQIKLVEDYLILSPIIEINASLSFKKKYLIKLKGGAGRYKSEINFIYSGVIIPGIQNSNGMIYQQNGNISRFCAEFGLRIFSKGNLSIKSNLGFASFISRRSNDGKFIYTTNNGNYITSNQPKLGLPRNSNNLEINANLGFDYRLNKKLGLFWGIGFSYFNQYDHNTGLDRGIFDLLMLTNTIGFTLN